MSPATGLVGLELIRKSPASEAASGSAADPSRLLGALGKDYTTP